MNPEDLEKQGVARLVNAPESGGEKEEKEGTKKEESETKGGVPPKWKEAETMGVIPPKENPPLKRSRSPRDGATLPPKNT